MTFRIPGIDSFRALFGARQTDVEKLIARGQAGGLVRALQHQDPAVRQAAAEALGEHGDPRAAAPLIAALGDDQRAVRRAATQALVQLGDPSAEPLTEALQAPEWRVRQAAAEALGQIAWSERGQAQGVQLAAELDAAARQDPEPRVRVAALKALGHEAGEPGREDLDARVETTLLAGLQDESWAVRKAAAEGLVRLGEPAAPHLMAASEHAEWGARQAAAVAMGKLGMALDAPVLRQQLVLPLTRLVRDEEARVRLAAVRALGQMGGCLDESEARGQIVKALSVGIRDGDGQVREAAAIGLGRTGGSRAVAALVTALEDPDDRVQAAVDKALDRLARGQGIDTGPIRV